MIALGIDLSQAPLDVYTVVTLLGTIIVALVLRLALRERRTIGQALTTRLELVMANIVTIVAGVSLLTHGTLLIVAVLALFGVMSAWFSVGALSLSGGADAVMLPVVLYLFTRGRASLQAREHLQPLSNPESATGKERP